MPGTSLLRHRADAVAPRAIEYRALSTWSGAPEPMEARLLRPPHHYRGAQGRLQTPAVRGPSTRSAHRDTADRDPIPGVRVAKVVALPIAPMQRARDFSSCACRSRTPTCPPASYSRRAPSAAKRRRGAASARSTAVSIDTRIRARSPGRAVREGAIHRAPRCRALRPSRACCPPRRRRQQSQSSSTPNR